MTDKSVSDKRIVIVGTGANGAAFGADMVNAGLDVSFVEQWPDHVEAMRADGLRVEMPNETVTTPVNAFHLCDVATMRAPFDVVFLGVKAYDTRWACELIKPLVAPDGLVVGLQNGMTLDDVAAVMGPGRTMGAVIEVAGGMYEAGVVIRQTGPDGTWFGIGAYDDATRGREQEVVDILRHAGTAEIKDDIRSAKWMKLVVNAAEFLPSSILGLPLAEAIKIPGMREVMMASGREAVHTAMALGHDLVPIFGNTHVEANDPDGYATVLLDAVLSDWTLPDTKVTVLQDWLKGRRAEVSDINGLVVREQAALGGTVPVNAGLVEIAHRIERGEIQADVSNADLLRSLLD
jgi:2-dehydropantoate 2-reductase